MLTPLINSLAHLLLLAVKSLTAIHNSAMQTVISGSYQGYGTAGLPAVGQAILCGGAPSIGTSMEQFFVGGRGVHQLVHPWSSYLSSTRGDYL